MKILIETDDKITNRELFENIFGFTPNDSCMFPTSACLLSSQDETTNCDKCGLKNFWDKEYHPCFELKPEL